MNRLGAIRSTARLSDYLFRHAFPLYALLYERYKCAAERDAIALDEFLGLDPLQFVKMDVQGAEYAALRGMREVLASSPQDACRSMGNLESFWSKPIATTTPHRSR